MGSRDRRRILRARRKGGEQQAERQSNGRQPHHLTRLAPIPDDHHA
jgi:hypothetical protein